MIFVSCGFAERFLIDPYTRGAYFYVRLLVLRGGVGSGAGPASLGAGASLGADSLGTGGTAEASGSCEALGVGNGESTAEELGVCSAATPPVTATSADHRVTSSWPITCFANK